MIATSKPQELFMTVILHNLIGKIDENTVAILTEIDTIARELKLAFFIVGATARDILLQHAHGIHPTRATLDIDIGVFVSDWDQFQILKKALVRTGKFSSTRQAQRLLYDDELPLDFRPADAGKKTGHRSTSPGWRNSRSCRTGPGGGHPSAGAGLFLVGNPRDRAG